MKKVIFLAPILLLFNISLPAQAMSRSYTTALGVKFQPGAVSFKNFVQGKNALEALGTFWNWGSRFTVLYEIHQDIKNAPGLKWYVGPGAHVGFWNTRYKNRYGSSGAYFGVDGVLGLDYKINKAPLNISIDWQPSFNFGDYDLAGFDANWGGFAIRYTFN
jgi:hypothetical protein